MLTLQDKDSSSMYGSIKLKNDAAPLSLKLSALPSFSTAQPQALAFIGPVRMVGVGDLPRHYSILNYILLYATFGYILCDMFT